VAARRRRSLWRSGEGVKNSECRIALIFFCRKAYCVDPVRIPRGLPSPKFILRSACAAEAAAKAGSTATENGRLRAGRLATGMKIFNSVVSNTGFMGLAIPFGNAPYE